VLLLGRRARPILTVRRLNARSCILDPGSDTRASRAPRSPVSDRYPAIPTTDAITKFELHDSLFSDGVTVDDKEGRSVLPSDR